jgi:uroporphyrinogen-III synthase
MAAQTLAGFTIGVTASRGADEQLDLLSERGAECVHGPTVEPDPVGPKQELYVATAQIIEHPPDVVVFTSDIGVRGWMDAAERAQLAEPLRASLVEALVMTRGSRARTAAIDSGFEVAWTGSTGRTGELVAELDRRGVWGRTVVVQFDGSCGESLATAIRELGATYVPVSVYGWPLPDDLGPATRLARATWERRLDAVTFAGRPAVENLVGLARELEAADDLLDALAVDVVAVCIDDDCAAGLAEHGIEPLVPSRRRLDAMVQLIAAHFESRTRSIDLEGHHVVLQGRMVTVDGGEPLRLTDRERGVLETLAERPGAVVSKRALLQRVWGAGESDEHVVEVTIARLRSRLGDAADDVETVIRRGYRLRAASAPLRVQT